MTVLEIAVLSLAACVYGASSAAKLASRYRFLAYQTGLRETELLPAHLLAPAARLLAGGEAAAAASLTAAAVLTAAGLPGATAVSAVALAGATMLACTLAAGIAVLVRRGIQARCACFGPGSASTLGRPQLARNLLMLALLAAGLAASQVRHGVPSPAAALLAAMSGALTATVLVRLDDLLTLFTPVSPGSARR
jgi:hypothetical protein